MTETDSLCAKAARSYREEHVNGLSQKELILMLYDGAIKFSGGAKEAYAENRHAEAYALLTKARNIILELLRILNMEQGGDIARNLQRLYIYIIGRFIEVTFTKEMRLLDNVLVILHNLRSAWAQIDFEQATALYESEQDANGNSSAPRSTAS